MATRTDSAPTSALPVPAALDEAVPAAGTPVLDVVVPVLDEAHVLERSVRRLRAHLDDAAFPLPALVTIADNASTDGTWAVAQRLADELPGVRALHLDERGRGRALRAAWTASDAPVVAYMDVDLSTDLGALLPLVAPIASGHSDLVVGSRLHPGARVVRGVRREVISRGYNVLLHWTLRTRVSDAQCGFKAVRADCARALLPLVEDQGWFFDTELLVLAERAGLRVQELPVDWVDDPDSRVHVVRTARDDLRGIARVGRALLLRRLPLDEVRDRFGRGPLPPGAHAGAARTGLATQLLRFGSVGVASTVAYLVLFALLRGPAGAQLANLVALLVTAVANTSVNRRLTFGVRGRRHAARGQLEGLVVFLVGLGLTSGSLAVLHAADAHPSRTVELASLVVANGLVTVLRFVALRAWVFHPRRTG